MKKSRKTCSQNLPTANKDTAILFFKELNGMKSTKILWMWEVLKGLSVG